MAPGNKARRADSRSDHAYESIAGRANGLSQTRIGLYKLTYFTAFAGPRARDFTNQRYRWGSRVDERIKVTNRTKSRVRAKVEHTSGVTKRVFGFQKVHYRGLAKNVHRLKVTAALTNLYPMRRRLLNA